MTSTHSLLSFSDPHKNRWCVRGQKNWLFLAEFEIVHWKFLLLSLFIEEKEKNTIHKVILIAHEGEPELLEVGMFKTNIWGMGLIGDSDSSSSSNFTR